MSTRIQGPFLSACRGEPTSFTPIWLMRQAGRYMKEYRDVRAKVSFLELCKNPDLASEVTITAVDYIGADAAIIFADILLITEPMGFQLEFAKGDGPKIHNPFRSKNDLARITSPDPKNSLDYVMKAIQITRDGLKDHIPLIGFCGAPFTVASYSIEGGSSRNFEHTKTLMRSDPETWNTFLAKITDGLVDYLLAQVEAGADALQIFDSWIGCLSPAEYRTYVLPHMKHLFSKLPQNIPTIHFGTGTAMFLEDMKEAGSSVMGVDFRIELGEAWKRLGDIPLQGNLDPTTLLCPPEIIRAEATKILNQAAGRPGYIFNLGHGILPQTPVDHVKRLIDHVHEFRFE